MSLFHKVILHNKIRAFDLLSPYYYNADHRADVADLQAHYFQFYLAREQINQDDQETRSTITNFCTAHNLSYIYGESYTVPCKLNISNKLQHSVK